MKYLFLMVAIMTIEAFAKERDWEQFNSSLLLEVTRTKGVFTCTGVALSPTVIATAAHCLDGDVKRVRVFTQKSYDPKQPSLEIASFSVHPDYAPAKSQYQNDIGKIVMKAPLPPSIHIKPILHENIVIGDIYRFGFGMRNKKNLRTVITPSFKVVNSAEKTLELYDTFSMSGDSGGPIFVQKGDEIKVVAIHSTLSFGDAGRFSFNPLLSAYQHWFFPN